MGKSEPSPTTLKCWDRRPWPNFGDPDQDRLYAAIGRAISEWERYEAVLSFLFANFVGAPILLAARRAYSAVRTFEGRAEMLRAASQAYFLGYGADAAKLRDPFKEVKRDAKEFSSRRNEIVHGVVDHYIPKPPDHTSIPAPATYALFPAYATFKHRSEESVPSYCYGTAELEYFRQRFLLLKRPALDLSAQLAVLAHNLALRQRHRVLYRGNNGQEPDQGDPK